MHMQGTIGRRVAGLMLAFAMAIGLIQVASPSAHADPSGPISKFDWDIGELYFTGDVAHQNYWDAINALHQISGHAIPNHPEVSGRVSETTLLPTRLIEARLVNAGDYIGSLYWWADNLYFAGFYQDSTHTHYVFPDVWPNEFRQVTGSPRVETLPWSGNYSRLPGGDTTSRQTRAINTHNLTGALESIGDAQSRLSGDSTAFGRNLTTIIQATSEAARFGRIFDVIRGNLRDGTSNALGQANVTLQQGWDGVSSWIYRWLGGTHSTLVFNGVAYATLDAWLNYVGYMELNSKAPR